MERSGRGASLWQEGRLFGPRMSEEHRERLHAGWWEAVRPTRAWAKIVTVE